MTSKPKELLELEREWLEKKRVLQEAYKATDAATRRYVASEGHEAKSAAWNELNGKRKLEHAATTAFLKLEHALTAYYFKIEHKNPCGGEFTPRSSRVAWSTDPEKRKRQRKHIAESIAKKKTIENPAPPPLPGMAVLLGEAVELEVLSDNGRRRTFKGSGDSALLSDADGDAIAIVRPDKIKEADPSYGSADAKKTWHKWSGFTVDAALLLKVTDRPLKFSLGTATVIRYRSDKWTGKALYYEHKFETKDFHVWADSSSSPRAILITAFPPRRLVTARGIVG
jgi:hypothetical protein